MSTIEARAGMLRLAADYDAMARRAEEWSGQTKTALGVAGSGALSICAEPS